MTEHRINLRGPWTAVPEDGGPPAQFQWPQLEGTTAIRLVRRFGAPRISAGERVALVIGGMEAEVSLNGERLGTATGEVTRFDVTGRLKPRNELVVCPVGPVTGEVALAIS